MVENKNKAEDLKNKGNDKFKAGKVDEAIGLYTQALGKFGNLKRENSLFIRRNSTLRSYLY